MAGLSRRLQMFEREWIVDNDALTLAEREADYRCVLRAVRDEYEREGNADLPFIVDVIRLESDDAALEQADEALLREWARRHGYTEDQIARNRSERSTRTRLWLTKLARLGI